MVPYKTGQGKDSIKITAVLPANAVAPPMVMETPGYIPQWIKDKMPKTDTQVSPQTQQKPQMTREKFDAEIDKIILLPVEQQKEAFDVLRSRINVAKSEGRCSEALYLECKMNWQTTAGRQFDIIKDFDDCDLF
jgi:hypothetical protein